MKAARRGPPRREGGAACGGGNARAARMSDGAANCARRSSEVSLHTSPSRTRSTPSRNSRPPTPPNGAHHRGTRSGRRRSPTTAASIGRRHQTTGQPAGRPVAPLASGRRLPYSACFRAWSSFWLMTLVTPSPCMDTPKSTSAISMVRRWWVIMMSWVSSRRLSM